MAQGRQQQRPLPVAWSYSIDVEATTFPSPRPTLVGTPAICFRLILLAGGLNDLSNFKLKAALIHRQ